MKYENTLPLSAVEVEALLEELRSGDPESTINEWQNSVMQSDESEKKPDTAISEQRYTPIVDLPPI